MSDSTPKELIDLYQQMSDLTKPECAACRAPHSCCSGEYCVMAEEIALERGVTLERTDHETLPFMGPDGCTVPPHLRPICTLHTCDISAFGSHRSDVKWTERYFKLRDRIGAKEQELWEQVQTLHSPPEPPC